MAPSLLNPRWTTTSATATGTPRDDTDHGMFPLDHPLARRHVAADRLVVIFGDIEMLGGAGPADDFPHDAWLAELLSAYSAPPFADTPVDLVFNGDSFDLLKTPVAGAYPHRVDAATAVSKLRAVDESHPAFFGGVRRFLGEAEAPRRVAFVVGNHDAELVFPDVQETLREMCGGSERVLFPGFQFGVGDLHGEHGSQHDPIFRVDPERQFIEDEGRTLLNLPWGAVALIKAVLPLQSLLYFHDRIQPRDWLMELFPELQELLMARMRQYWTRDYWQDLFDWRDPTGRLSWPAFKEVLYRFMSKNPQVHLQDDLEGLIRQPSGPRVVVVGHSHEPRIVTFGDRKLIQAGCMRDEFMIDGKGRLLRPIPKSYVEIYQRRGHTVRSLMLEVDGPRRPAEEIPESIFEVQGKVRALLRSEGLEA